MALVEVLDGFLPLVVGLVVMERGVGVVMGVWMPVVVERWVEGATIGEVRVTHPWKFLLVVRLVLLARRSNCC